MFMVSPIPLLYFLRKRVIMVNMKFSIGGGFSMGSSYFYLEFLLICYSQLKSAGYKNPAIFALEYTLVPEGVYPTQLNQALAGYKYVYSRADNDSSKICISGDSAG